MTFDALVDLILQFALGPLFSFFTLLQSLFGTAA
jgi:hypothetical protein